MIVVSNTTPLIGLASLQRLDLLPRMFGEIVIAQAVFDEAVVAERKARGVIWNVLPATWLKVADVKDRLAVEVMLDEMDLGEAETIVLAKEIRADWVLMDEKRGRRKLDQLGLPKIGTVGILLKAKQVEFLPSIRLEIELLRERGFSLSQAVVDAVLRQAGESA
jgi:predicted nucleic acid-binding protein